jgi:phosphoglycerate dehydrogenase-like enzyme
MAAGMKVVTSVYLEPTWTFPPEQLDRLRRDFPRLRVVDAASREARLRELPDAEIAFLPDLKRDEFAVASRLRWIQSPAAGVAGMLFPELRESPVVLTNARGIHGEAMAEHVIGVAIVLFRQIHRAIRDQARHAWAKPPQSACRTIRGRTMGIVGLGAIGLAVAERASAMGMAVIASRRRIDTPRPACVTSVYPPDQLAELLGRSDVVVLTAPLTSETRGLIGARELRQMKPSAVLVNVARGKLVNERALAEALISGTIAGAALDVFEHEPLAPDSPLWDLPTVVITPHTSAYRDDYWAMVVDLFEENLRRFERGQELVNVVDKRAGY